MKRALFLTVAIVSFAMMSCKKCQECTTDVSQQVMGINQQVSATTDEYCDDQYDDAPTPTTYSQQVGSITQTVTITCQDK